MSKKPKPTKGKQWFTLKDGRVINNNTIVDFVKDFPMPEPFAWKIMPTIEGFFVALTQHKSDMLRIFLYENGSWYEQPRFTTKQLMLSLAKETKRAEFSWIINPNFLNIP